MNIKLLSNRVLIEVGNTETKTANGLVIPGGEQEIKSGTIVAVGLGKDTEQGHVDMKVKVGDKVMFQYGQKIQVEGKPYILGGEEDVIMILDPK